VLVWLFSAAQQHRGGAHAAARRRAQSVVITLGPESPPQLPPKPLPAPTPTPQPQPKPSTQTAPAKPAARTAPAHSEPRAAALIAPAPDPNQESDDVLGSIRDNWLEPPGLKPTFLCHVRIDYRADGTITQITFTNGCGNAVVVDSIRRAIWKTQPLPLAASKQQAGSLELDLAP
jgi:hypothetical protein